MAKATHIGSATACSLPLRSTVVWKNRHTDVTIWPAHKRATALIVFISGNPGLVSYYDTFLSQIHATSSLYWEVIGLGHLGQSPDHPLSLSEALQRHPKAGNQQGLPSLQDQIDSKIAFLDGLRPQFSDDTKVILIGHSVGAYICQEIVKRRPEMVHGMYGLFPSLAHIAKTPNGLKLAPLFHDTSRIVVTAFVLLLKLILPSGAVKVLVRMLTGQQDPAAQTTARLVTSPAVVSAAIKMGADEMQTIKDLDEEFFEQHGKKITLYFAAGDSDSWVGKASRVKEITAALDRSKTGTDARARWHICAKGMQHAFCLEHSNEMADLCAAWLARDLSSEVQ